MAFAGSFLCKMCLNNRFKSSRELFCFDLEKIVFDLLIGETKTPHSYDFGILGRVQTPENQLCLLLESPGYLKKSRNDLEHFKSIDFVYLEIWEILNFDNFGKDRRRK